jgi:hypothetical protein
MEPADRIEPPTPYYYGKPVIKNAIARYLVIKNWPQ